MLKHWLMAALLLAPGAVLAQKSDTGNTNPEGYTISGRKVGPDLTVKDRQFIERAASDNLAQVQLARLALERSQSSTVQKYARDTIEARQKQSTSLMAISAQENFPEPDKMDTAHQASFDRLSKLSGDAFDSAYLQLMVRDNDQSTREVAKASSELSNPELLKFAKSMLPALRSSKSIAKRDLGSVKM
jgi:putative membrane protein